MLSLQLFRNRPLTVERCFLDDNYVNCKAEKLVIKKPNSLIIRTNILESFVTASNKCILFEKSS